MTLEDKYPTLLGEDIERLDHIVASLKHIIHYANGVIEDINAGTFTPAEARRTAEEMICSEGFDFVSAIEDYGMLANEDEEVERFVEEFHKTENRLPTSDEVAKFRENASK